jgi:hypothetical protein
MATVSDRLKGHSVLLKARVMISSPSCQSTKSYFAHGAKSQCPAMTWTAICEPPTRASEVDSGSIRETFADVPAAKITADLQPLPYGSPPSSFFVPARCGFYCPACPAFRSFHEREIQHHSVKVHGHNTWPTEVQKNACYLQGWIKRRIVQSTRYWIVDTSVESSPCCPHNHDQSNSPQQDAEAELLELEAEEEDRLCRDPEIVIHDDLETDEDSEWLRACNWAT